MNCAFWGMKPRLRHPGVVGGSSTPIAGGIGTSLAVHSSM